MTGYSKLDSRVRHFDIEVNDALELAGQTEVDSLALLDLWNWQRSKIGGRCSTLSTRPERRLRGGEYYRGKFCFWPDAKAQ